MTTTIITECGNCGVDADVHLLDGCDELASVRVRVCVDCREVPAECTCMLGNSL